MTMDQRLLMQGTSATTFGGGVTTSRGMIATILYRLDGEPDADLESIFTDVAAGSYYHDAILWAEENGIVTGYGGGVFGPDDPITREQLAAMLYRYARYKGYDVSVGEDTNILSYNDAFEISEYAIPAMQWAVGVKLFHELGEELKPTAEVTRAETAWAVARFIELETPDTSGKVMTFSETNSTATDGGLAVDVIADNKKYLLYVVRRGDTLYAISQQHGCTVAEIVALNGELISDPNLILVGWELRIPQA